MKVGDKAPQFSLPDRNAQKVHLRNYFGQWVVLFFYPRDNTPGCTMEATSFSNHLDEFEELNAIVMGISPDSVKSHYGFCKKYKLRIILLSDREKGIMTKYGVWRNKKIYGREQPGAVRSTFLVNPSGRIVHIWDKVRVKGHVQEVLDTLRSLKKKKA